MTDTPHRGYSEETCVRCGWKMGDPPMSCQNDDTPHRFPSSDHPLFASVADHQLKVTLLGPQPQPEEEGGRYPSAAG